MGIEIFENTPMTKLDFGQPATVSTPDAQIKAKQVVLALNAWMVEHFTQFKNSIVVVSSDMVITKPLGESLRKTGWQAERACWIRVFLFITTAIRQMVASC